jgi:hypothetical protein
MAMAKVICEEIFNGEEVLRSYTTAAGTAETLVKTHPGVGHPFWSWPTVPPGKIIAADFTDAPIATNDTAQNRALIAAITKTPEEVLIYAPPP